MFICTWLIWQRLSIKTVFPRYGDPHVKNKMAVRPFYLRYGDPYTGKKTPLYWDGPQGFMYSIVSQGPWHPVIGPHWVNSSFPGQNGCHFADYIFKCIFMNRDFCISILISLKFVPKGVIDNMSALFQVMSWCQTGDKPLPKPMLMQFTGAYRGEWVNQ